MSSTRRPHRHAPVRVPATEAAKNFGRLVNHVREERATYIVERGGRPVAQLGPVTRAPFTLGDLKALAADLPAMDDDYRRAVEKAARRHNRPRVRRNPWAR